MENRTSRIGQNEAVFRQVNEQVQGLNDAFGMNDRMAMVCECGDQTCIEHIDMTREEYERVRGSPVLFAILPGHELTDVEVVLETNERFSVVEKREGEPARIAREADPRSDGR